MPVCSNVRESDPSGGCSRGWQTFCFCLGCYKDRLLRTGMGEVLRIFLTSRVTMRK